MPRRTAARRLVLRRLVDSRLLTSQDEIVAALREEGFVASQATVSRDLSAIGARRRGDGPYTVAAPSDDARPGPDVVSILQRFVVSIVGSGQLVVVKTVAGTASTVAEFLDRAAPPGLLGSVAGDDTVLAVAPDGGALDLANRLERFLEG